MIEVKNKRAYFDYTVLEELEIGIALTGTEIKSVRNGSVDLKDSFINIKNNEYKLNKAKNFEVLNIKGERTNL